MGWDTLFQKPACRQPRKIEVKEDDQRMRVVLPNRIVEELPYIELVVAFCLPCPRKAEDARTVLAFRLNRNSLPGRFMRGRELRVAS